jgi:hypothetical protein
MADFCNKCAYAMWREKFPPEIDVPFIFKSLDKGYMTFVLCEGCGMTMIAKSNDGKCILEFGEDGTNEIDIHEYIIPKNKRIKLCQKLEE